MKSQPPTGLSNHCYDVVKNQLMAGAINQDEWIQIDEIARDLDMSRQPVMDAMKRLAIEGFIHITPQRGCRPRHYDTPNILEFFVLFADNEALIAKLAAIRAEREDILTLRLASSQILALKKYEESTPRVADQYRQLNRKLHSEIRRISRSPIISQIVERQGDLSDFFIASHQVEVFASHLFEANSEHDLIIDSIEKNDPDTACVTMKQHVLNVRDRLEKALVDPDVAL